MPDRHEPLHTAAQHPQPDGGDRGERRCDEIKQQLLTRTAASNSEHITDSLVIKDGDLFFLSRRDGDVPNAPGHALGLYHHDCRFLSGYTLEVCGGPLRVLSAGAAEGHRSVIGLTNGQPIAGEGFDLAKDSLLVRWEHTIDPAYPSLLDTLSFEYFGSSPVVIAVRLAFAAGFEDVFNVRGMIDDHPGRPCEPRWIGDTLVLAYVGADGVTRRTAVAFDAPLGSREQSSAVLRLELEPGRPREVRVTIAVQELEDGEPVPDMRALHDIERVDREASRGVRGWIADFARIDSNDGVLDRIVQRSILDLRMLRSEAFGCRYFAAGTPWFATLFGRDTIIACIESLALHAPSSEDALRLLCRLQGERSNANNDEQPGRMPHELRRGELTRAGVAPYLPYYGTIDATPLFLILLGLAARWTGRIDLFRSLQGNVRRALRWMDEFGDADGDGFIEYGRVTGVGHVNLGWKDSGNAIVNADGSLAEPPIALTEVQGYAYLARTLTAELYEREGEHAEAERLRAAAARLKEQFNREFWLEDEGFFAMALQQGGRPVASIGSNPGQALWTGIVDDDKARRVAERLMCDDMFSGWGLRTLSASARAYNPIGYHLGTVWPHDNAIIVAGLRRYGQDEAASRVVRALLEAAERFEDLRLPETFSGVARGRFTGPVHYPVACRPQAWAARRAVHDRAAARPRAGRIRASLARGASVLASGPAQIAHVRPVRRGCQARSAVRTRRRRRRRGARDECAR